MNDRPPGPDPDQAWKTLTLVNDWIKHADTKVAATLAATTATALALYNLLGGEKSPNCVFLPAAVVCAVLLFWTATCSLRALIPRTRRGSAKQQTFDSLLFFSDIAHTYPNAKRAAYVHALGELTIDNQALCRQIAEQIHANAEVASLKYRWVNRAIRTLAFALLALAIAAIASVWN